MTDPTEISSGSRSLGLSAEYYSIWHLPLLQNVPGRHFHCAGQRSPDAIRGVRCRETQGVGCNDQSCQEHCLFNHLVSHFAPPFRDHWAHLFGTLRQGLSESRQDQEIILGY